jgi:hypothetical protein
MIKRTKNKSKQKTKNNKTPPKVAEEEHEIINIPGKTQLGK